MQQKITTDFALASWLFCHDTIKMVSHTREQNRSIFSFQGADIDQLVEDYESNTAIINIKNYTTATRDLKNIMYSGASTQPNNKIWNNTMTR